MIEHLRHMMRFDRWATGETIQSVQRAANVPAKALATLAHLVSAERLWLDRIHGRKPLVAVWPEQSIDEIAKIAADVSAEWERYLGDADEATLRRTVLYTNSRGEEFKSSIASIVLHLVTHGAYHRGQVATLLRQNGETPAYVDYIHADRNHLIEE